MRGHSGSKTDSLEDEIQILFAILKRIPPPFLPEDSSSSLPTDPNAYRHLSRTFILSTFRQYRDFLCTKWNIPGLSSLLVNPHFSSSSYYNHPATSIQLLHRQTGYFSHQPMPTYFLRQFHKLVTINAHKLAAFSCIYDKTGLRIITGGDDFLVKIWCSKTGWLIHTLRGHQDVIIELSLNFDNTILASASNDGCVRLWRLQTGEPLATFPSNDSQSQKKGISSIQFLASLNPSISIVVTTGLDGYSNVFEWKMEERKLLRRSVLDCRSVRKDELQCLAVSPLGTHFAVAGGDGIIRIFSVVCLQKKSNKRKYPAYQHPLLVAYLDSHLGTVGSMAFNCLGDRLLSGSIDGTGRIWHYNQNLKVWDSIHLVYEEENIVTEESGSFPDEQQNEQTSGITIGNPTRLGRGFHNRHTKHVKVTRAIWTPCGQVAILAYSNGTIRTWDALTGSLIHVLNAHLQEVYVLASHPFSDVLISAGLDGDLVLWNWKSGELLHKFSNSDRKLLDAQFSMDGQQVLCIDNGGSFTIYGFEDDKEPFEHGVYEQMFLNDYQPLQFDNNLYAIDDNTQMAPHLLPRSFVCDFDGREYSYQKGKDYGLKWPEKVSQNKYQLDVLIQLFEDQRPYLESMCKLEIPPALDKKIIHKRRKMYIHDSDSESAIEDVVETNVAAEVNLTNQALIADHSSDEDYTEEEYEQSDNSEESHSRHESSSSNVDDFSDDSDFEVNSSPTTSVSGRVTRRTKKKSSDYDEYTESKVSVRKEGSSRKKRSQKRNYQENSDSSFSSNESTFSSSGNHRATSVQSSGRRKKRQSRKISKNNEPMKKKAKVRFELEETINENPINAPEKWVMMTKQTLSPYFPQIYDEIVYFKEGHEEFLQNAGPEFRENIPFKNHCLPCTVICRITSIHFRSDPFICELNLEIMDNNPEISHELKGETIKVLYWDLENTPEFIILYSLYLHGIREDFQVGDEVEALLENDRTYNGHVVKLNAGTSPWQKYCIQWEGEETIDTLSPWELFRPGTFQHFFSSSLEMVAHEDLERMMKVVSEAMVERHFFPFRELVDSEQFPTYYSIVTYPVCLSAILDRLENGWYRRKEAFLWDVDKIAENALLFNEPDSTISIHSLELQKYIYDRLREEERSLEIVSSFLEKEEQLQPSSSAKRRGRIVVLTSDEESE